MRLEGSPSEFMIQRKKSFGWHCLFFCFLLVSFYFVVLFVLSLCSAVCVFVCYYVYHVIRFALLACICGLSP